MKSVRIRKNDSRMIQVENPCVSTLDERELHERIAHQAYELYEKGGRTDGHELEHWLEAERIISEQLRVPG